MVPGDFCLDGKEVTVYYVLPRYTEVYPNIYSQLALEKMSVHQVTQVTQVPYGKIIIVGVDDDGRDISLTQNQMKTLFSLYGEWQHMYV